MTRIDIFENLMLPLKSSLTEESWKFLMSRGEKFIEQMREEDERRERFKRENQNVIGKEFT